MKKDVENNVIQVSTKLTIVSFVLAFILSTYHKNITKCILVQIEK